MLLQMNERTRIEDPRQYGSAVVNDLRNLLTEGRCAQRDPHRENFYEIGNDAHTFYIHISPINGEVLLVAKWLRNTREAGAFEAQLSA